MGDRNPYILRVSRDHVMVPARIAALLEREANLSAVRVRLRGVDPEASAVLEAVRAVAMDWRSCQEPTTEEVPGRKLATRSKWLRAGEVAEQLGITRQAVGKAIRDGRLAATRTNRGYQISRQDLAHFKAARAA